MSKNNFRAWNQDTQEFEYFTFGKNGHYTHSKLEIYSANAVKDWQQSTGLKDKDGVEIYEGDIVKCWDGKTWLDKPSKVYFANGAFWPNPGDFQFEIIGNIHENPELLKEQN